MLIKPSKFPLFVTSTVLAVCILTVKPLSGQRDWHQGDTWLGWKRDARVSYVFGYMVGYSTGRWDGCAEDAKDSTRKINLADENDPTNRCQHEGPDFSKGSDYFVNAITDLYKRYPEDRELDIGEVLEQMGRGLSVEEVHNHPFPRHAAPNPKP